jgi:hypothetical protein
MSPRGKSVKTLFSVVFLLIVGAFANFLWVFVGNIAGLPGALLAGPRASRPISRFWLGTQTAFLRLSLSANDD